MSFFTSADDLRVIERNIQRLQGIEEREAKKMALIFVEARRRIIDSLLSSTSGSFTEAQLQLSLNQVDAILGQLKNVTKARNIDSSEMVQEQSITDLGREISRFSREFEGVSRVIPVDEILLSLDSQNLLINRFQSSIDRYTESVRDTIQRELTQAILSTESSATFVRRLNNEIKSKEWQILRITITELHNVYNFSKNEGMAEIKKVLVADLKKTVITPMDGRTDDDSKFFASLKQVVDIDKSFKYTWRGKKRIFFTPPDRPNDRSILVPYRKVWDK